MVIYAHIRPTISTKYVASHRVIDLFNLGSQIGKACEISENGTWCDRER
jgi:hypothetical protein